MIRRIFIHLPQDKQAEFIVQLLTLYNDKALTENIGTLIKNSFELMETFSLSATDFYRQLFLFVLSAPDENEKDIIRKFLIQIKEEQIENQR